MAENSDSKQLKGILNKTKAESPKRTNEENMKRRISWGNKKIKEFNQASTPSNSEESKKCKSNTKWGEEYIEQITPDNRGSNEIDIDIEDDDDSIRIPAEERQRFIDELNSKSARDFNMNKNDDFVTDVKDEHKEEFKTNSKDHIMRIGQPPRVDVPLAPPSKNRRYTMYDKFKQVVTKAQNEAMKRPSTVSIFDENNVNEELTHEELNTTNKEQDSSDFVAAFIPERDSQLNSPASPKRVQSMNDSASKQMIMLEKERIKQQDNKEKLTQLYHQVRSPRPSRRLIEDDLTDNTKMKISIDAQEAKEIDYRRLLR
jgi:hypothetical protein